MSNLRIKVGAALGLGLALAGMGSGGALAGSVSATYYLGLGDMLRTEGGQSLWDHVGCGGEAENKGVSGACMKVGGTKVTITIKDASGQPTPARVFEFDGTKTDEGADAILVCGTKTFDLQDGTAYLDVRVGVLGRGTIPIPPGTALFPIACPTPEPVTTGTITITGDGIGAGAGAVSTEWTSPAARVGTSPETAAAATTIAQSTRAGNHFRLL